MKEFECFGPDGRVYLHYDNWCQWRGERLREYPGNDGWDDKWRIDLEIAYPRDHLEDVPVDHNPHGHLSPHACFYQCHDWSTIFGVHDAHLYSTGDQSLRMLVESCNPEPVWGENIALFSTSGAICPESWGRIVPNRFAFFRHQWWKVTWCELLHEWPAGRVFYPLSNVRSLARAGDWRWDWLRTTPVAGDWRWPQWDWHQTTPVVQIDPSPRLHQFVNWKENGF